MSAFWPNYKFSEWAALLEPPGLVILWTVLTPMVPEWSVTAMESGLNPISGPDGHHICSQR